MRRQGRPAENRHSLQIEVDRRSHGSAHLAAAPRFDRLRADLTHLVQAVAEFVRSRLVPKPNEPSVRQLHPLFAGVVSGVDAGRPLDGRYRGVVGPSTYAVVVFRGQISTTGGRWISPVSSGNWKSRAAAAPM